MQCRRSVVRSVAWVGSRIGIRQAMSVGSCLISSPSASIVSSRRSLRIALGTAAVGALLLNGCAVGPDFERPDPPTVDGYLLGRQAAIAGSADGATQRLNRKRDVPGDWWRLFRSRGVRSLIAEALRNNPDLQA